MRKSTKTSRSRTIAIPDEPIAKLRNLRLDRAEAHALLLPEMRIFSTVLGRRLRQSNLLRWVWAPLLVDLEIPQRGLHGCRHTHIALLIAAGVSLPEVAKRAGHASANLTPRFMRMSCPWSRTARWLRSKP
ncbi:MAG: hypothetical protein JRG86_10415 [Deltaproteobacteria bacterium]|nr:hypothetical protein [Deltaproteobacteria bacterium]MBW2497981.1 hypothetical protein [Deltaproteobacteria bacterium]